MSHRPEEEHDQRLLEGPPDPPECDGCREKDEFAEHITMFIDWVIEHQGRIYWLTRPTDRIQVCGLLPFELGFSPQYSGDTRRDALYEMWLQEA